MRFIDIHIDGFGKFHNFDMHLEDGMNIIYGHNEAGKSTLHSFLQAMLYGLGRRSGKPLSGKYRSWEFPEDYSGQLRIEYKGKNYLIYKDGYGWVCPRCGYEKPVKEWIEGAVI